MPMRVPRAPILLALALTMLFARSASAGRPHDGDEPVRGRVAAKGEVLVHFQQGVAEPSNSDPDIDSDEPVGPGSWRLIHSRGRSAAALLAALRARPDVISAEPNYRVAVDGTPNDLVTLLWGLNNVGQAIGDGTVGTAGADIGAVRAWDTGTGSRSVVVATIDTGIMAEHQDLAANLWTAPRAFTVTIGGTTVTCAAGTHGFNAMTRTCATDDDNGHGTHVAGSIGATGGNGMGVVGVNWTTAIMAVKFLDASGTGYVSDAIDGIEFVVQTKQAFAATGDANVRVLNNSWTGGDYSQALADEIARAGASDMLFVAAAGNDAGDLDTQPAYPAGYAGANVLAVGSTDDHDQLSTFSSYGASSVHLAAPGTSIYSTYISPGSPGVSTYATMSGTSMATAYVSGAAALVLAQCPYSTSALRDLLLRTATVLPSLAGRIQSGRRLNAAQAVQACHETAPPPSDMVLHAAALPASARHGAWTLQADASAAGGADLATPDAGRPAASAPLASPADYFDVTFTAPAGIPYRLWLRLRATANSKWNDSVWVQFSDALVDGAPAWGINTTAAATINLENCSNCGVAGWGWQDGAYWLPRPAVTFSSSGTHTLRVQVREDGVQIDQIVLSPSTYLSSAPGQAMGDGTILQPSPESAGAPPPAAKPTPFGASPMAVPGTVHTADFDQGGEGVAYHDTTSGNAGGVYRQTDVDIAASSEGGTTVGWIEAGEWLHYTVNVAAAGQYNVALRVASPSGGGSLRVAFDANGVLAKITMPATGGWQNWTTVTIPVTLNAGVQPLRLLFDTNGFNVSAIDIRAASAAQHVLAPYGGSPRAVPGTIAAADFDDGGEGVAYHDASPGNAGGAYRQTDVDIAPSSEGGYTIGWIDGAEWANYTVDVAAAGRYTVHLRVAAPAAGGLLHLGFNGSSSVWTQIAIPATGDWQRWTTVDVPVTIGAGRQQITLYFDTSGYNVSWLSVDQP
jgi:subtilisin family serine protease